MLVAHSYYIIFSPVVKRNRQGNLCLCLREFSHIIGKNNSPQRRILGVCTLDTRPIGVFDSGLGGLTALRELSRLLPGEDIIYFGDTGRVPYGGRSRETLIRYARQDVAFLRTFDLKGIVVACGTVSTTALDVLTAENDIPIWGVVEPASDAAVQATRNGKIGLIGTQASIRSGAYERRIASLRPDAQVFAAACPLFVPLVENGRFRPGDLVAETVAAEYLQPLKADGIDTLMLGCTHYPLLKRVIGGVMGPDVTLVDVGEQCARRVAGTLRERGSLTGPGRTGRCRFFVSVSVEGFSGLASIFLQRDVTEDVEKVDIWNY